MFAVALPVCGFVVGFVGLYLHKIRSGPCLEPWHTELLEAEFTVNRLGEVDTFDAYLKLEDQLFDDLEKQVYSQIGSGSAYALIRYSSGSRSDPGRTEHTVEYGS